MLQRLMRLGVVFGLLFSLVSVFAVHAEAVVLPITITEVQTGGLTQSGAADAKAEFVELYNPNPTSISVVGWQLQYLSEAHSGTGAPSRVLGNLTGELAPFSFTVFAYTGYFQNLAPPPVPFVTNFGSGSLAQGSGSVRLVNAFYASNPAIAIVDTIGWGSANIKEGKIAVAPPTGKSLQRCLDKHDVAVDTNDNATDFSVYEQTTPGTGTACPEPAVPEEPQEPEVPAEPQISCEGIELSEFLPNAAGSDSGHEFIELYNPTNEVINLSGCALQTSSSSKLYIFGETSFNPGAYQAFYDDITGLTLPNSNGGSVWLLSKANVELQSIIYPANMEDDTAWAVINSVWQTTYAPTPNAENIAMPLKPCMTGEVRNTVTGLCQAVTVTTPVAATLASCKAGQERNPDTKRCRTIATATSTLAVCKAGQERNPETNRCRSVLSAATTLVSCDVGQERNPATNRCKKIAITALAPCKTGQTRNSETNRCRNIVAASADLANVKDVQTGHTVSKAGWYITGAVVLAATTYAIYEWRQEILHRLKNLKK